MPDQQLLPRVIIQLNPDGTYQMESYINGQRAVTRLSSFDFQHMIVNELAAKQREIDNAAQRKAERLAKEEKDRHYRVWRNVAAGYGNNPGFGAHFANKVIGPKSAKPKQYLADSEELFT